MFSRFNNRITRSIIAVAVPALVTLNFSGRVFADGDDDQPAPQMLQDNVLEYTGQSNDGLNITMTIDYNTVNGNTVRGVMTINGTECPFVMELVQNNFEGIVYADDRQIPFTGTSQGTTVSLDILNTQLDLLPAA